jgi:hypothetical protein
MLSKQIEFLPPMSARARAQLPSINGVILSLCREHHPSKLQAKNGCVYHRDFCMPGISDMVGVRPLRFFDKKERIVEELEEIVGIEPTILSAKAPQQFSQFEAYLKKSITAVSIPALSSELDLLETLDAFICDLYRKNPNGLPNRTPLMTLARPQYLVRPHTASSAFPLGTAASSCSGARLPTRATLSRPSLRSSMSSSRARGNATK